MRTFKINYHDLDSEARRGALPFLIGRDEELRRFDRVLNRRISNNILVVGPDGIGKTTLVYGWVRKTVLENKRNACALLQFALSHLDDLDADENAEAQFAEALARMPESTIFIDDFGHAVFRRAELMQRIQRLYKMLLKSGAVRLILTLEPPEYAWLEREFPAFVRSFETIDLKEQGAFEYSRILSRTLPRLNAAHRIIVPDSALNSTIALAKRFRALGQMPHGAIRLLDESLAHSAAQGRRALTEESLSEVVEAKTGVPRAQLTGHELDRIKRLEASLNERVLGQRGAIAKIAATLQRAKLGLRNPDRPLGSFLFLGPSGVGKTETAKSVAEILFGRNESFIRFDMSEFQQDHTVQRLVGAPAGYIGYEDGGALTGALKRNPYSLILLDEIEKAHPKVFDIFLQLLDDGRLTSGQNETVDGRNAVVMATSNAAVAEIARAFSAGNDVSDEKFLHEKIVPVLAQTFRLEFLNRFDGIIIFNPLTIDGLVHIAEFEIRKIEKRLEKHRVKFDIDAATLRHNIERIADGRFGARPVKRFVEDACESLLVDSLLGQRV